MSNDLHAHLVQPRVVSLAAFPESASSTPAMTVLQADLTHRDGTALLGVKYAHKSGRALHLQIVVPLPHELRTPDDQVDHPVFPLVVFVQGSAWLEQSLGQALPSLARFAARGYVVAIVEYRPSTVAVFPAQVRDARTALRFLREHAAEYCIDVDRIALWGDSSGAHTAVLTALTPGEQAYSDEPVDDEQPVVRCVVDYYGPTDFSRMNEEPSIQDHIAPDSPEGLLIGGHDVLARLDLVEPTIVMNHVAPGSDVPPILIIHGSKDRLVPFGQSVLLHDALVAAGKSVELYQLKGADHGGPPFWHDDVLDVVDTFLRRHLPVSDGTSR